MLPYRSVDKEFEKRYDTGFFLSLQLLLFFDSYAVDFSGSKIVKHYICAVFDEANIKVGGFPSTGQTAVNINGKDPPRLSVSSGRCFLSNPNIATDTVGVIVQFVFCLLTFSSFV